MSALGPPTPPLPRLGDPYSKLPAPLASIYSFRGGANLTLGLLSLKPPLAEDVRNGEAALPLYCLG